MEKKMTVKLDGTKETVKAAETTAKATEATAKTAEATVKAAQEKVVAKAQEVKAAVKETVAEKKAKVEKAEKPAKPAKPAKSTKTAKKAEKEELKPEVFIQYQGREAIVAEAIEKAKAEFVAEGHRLSSIKSLQIYLKPEDYSAYYVINQKFAGRVDLF